MGGNRVFKIVVTTFLVFLILGLSLLYYLNNIPEEKEVEVLGESAPSHVPYITSVVPSFVFEGEEYIYKVRMVDSDTDFKDISLSMIEGPGWLSVEGWYLKGVAPLGSSGTYKVVLKVSDGYNSSTQESYILVSNDVR